MQNQKVTLSVFFVATSLLLANSAYAMDMGNMMNPSKWMGGNNDNDRYDDYRGGPGYGYPGYGPGYGYGGAPGYGPGYGYGGEPGYGAEPGYGGASAYGAPATGSNEEVMRLKERIRQLEGGLR